MDLLFTATYYLFLAHLVGVIIFWLNLWQSKEYRLDRMLIHMRDTTQGRRIIFGFEPLLKTAIFFLYIISIFYSFLYPLIPPLVFAIYGYEATLFVIDIITKNIKWPAFTPKLLFVSLFTVLFVFLFLMVPLLDKYFWLVFVDKFVLFIIAGLMGVLSFPSMFYKDTQINKAIKKLRRNKQVTVIGITGSFGKGSTKEFTYQILSQKFNTLRTHSRDNNMMGITRTILKRLNRSTHVFIVEMGGHRSGEVLEMASMVNPFIGIVTGVNTQHLPLFGNLKKNMDTKYELIESLPAQGIALFNANNENSRMLYHLARKRKKYLYGIGKESDGIQILAKNIRVHATSFTFDAVIGKDTYSKLHVQLVGAHQIQHILPAMYIARILKMRKLEIIHAVHNLTPLNRSMEPFRSERGTLLINDTHNANPASVIASLEYLAKQRGKKGIVLEPMIELGRSAKDEHFRVGQAIGTACSHLYVTDKTYLKEIRKGIQDVNGDCQIHTWSPQRSAEHIQQIFTKKDVVVFSGDGAEKVFQFIPHQRVTKNTNR